MVSALLFHVRTNRGGVHSSFAGALGNGDHSDRTAAAVVDRQYARADLEFRGLAAVNRVAPHAYTSEVDIDRFLDVVGGALRRARWRNAS
jgi:hypothetical protein